MQMSFRLTDDANNDIRCHIDVEISVNADIMKIMINGQPLFKTKAQDEFLKLLIGDGYIYNRIRKELLTKPESFNIPRLVDNRPNG